jgi:hypothetical protein
VDVEYVREAALTHNNRLDLGGKDMSFSKYEVIRHTVQ